MKLKCIVLFNIISINLFSQGINNLWLMGYQSWAGFPYGGTNINFDGGMLIVSHQNRLMNFSATNGVICDKNGNLLFSSNGVCIANANNDTMLNGDGLNPSYYTSISDSDGLNIPQGNLIIPFPGNITKYYLFHETDDDYFNLDRSFYFYYSVIDMAQDNGRGAVVTKNVVLLNDSLTPGFISGCKHGNGRDWWIFIHHYNKPIYHYFLVTPYDIKGPFAQTIGSPRGIFFGQMAFSPDGNKAAFYEPDKDLDIMDFDRCTGKLSNLVHIDINDSATAGGIAFSPNSKVLYVSSKKYIYQFDLTSSDIAASKITVAIYDGFYSPYYPLATTFALAQLAPDGKVYIASTNSTDAMHVINNPDNLGLSCNACQHCIQLTSLNFTTIPNHPNYFLGAETGSVCDSLTGVQSLAVQSAELKIYPNPSVTEDVTFTYNVSSEQGILAIYSIEGKEVVQWSIPQWSSVQHLKLPKMASGVYMARLTQGNMISNIKFLKE